MNDIYIKKYLWNKKENNILFNSIKKNYSINWEEGYR